MSDFEVVMPFVLVQSNGGPYDDAAYVAGWDMGALDARLAVAKILNLSIPARAMRRQDIPQIDLIAMKHGFIMQATDFSEDEANDEQRDFWVKVEFRDDRG